MMLEIEVPEQEASIAEALDKAIKCAASTLVVKLQSDFHEPRDAFPLEIQANTTNPISIEVIGPSEGVATIGDVALTASGPSKSGPSVVLRNVTVRGSTCVNGQGCVIEGCDVQHGIEIGAEGVEMITKCNISSMRHGVMIHGPALLTENVIQAENIGVCIYGNLMAILRGNQFCRCNAAGVVVHCNSSGEAGSVLQLAPQIHATNAFQTYGHHHEVNLDIDGAMSLSFNEWPMPVGKHMVEGRRGGQVTVEVEDGNTLRVVEVQKSEQTSSKKRRKRQRRTAQPDCEPILSEKETWARKVLGLPDTTLQLTMKQVQSAYRRSARQVHPDKQHMVPPCTRDGDGGEPEREEKEVSQHDGASNKKFGATTFLEVQAAYEALSGCLQDEHRESQPCSATRKSRHRNFASHS